MIRKSDLCENEITKWSPKYPCKKRKCNLCDEDFRSYKSICKKCENLNIWDQLRKYINKFENGEIITRQATLNIVGHGHQKTIDSYNNSLRKIKILERTKPGKYLKHKDVPKSLTVGLMRKLSRGAWESWFTPLDILDKLNEE